MIFKKIIKKLHDYCDQSGFNLFNFKFKFISVLSITLNYIQLITLVEPKLILKNKKISII